jgi:hypothetical protein
MLEKDPNKRIDWPALFSLEITDNGIKEGESSIKISNNSKLQQSIENIPPW